MGTRKYADVLLMAVEQEREIDFLASVVEIEEKTPDFIEDIKEVVARVRRRNRELLGQLIIERDNNRRREVIRNSIGMVM